MPNSTRLVPKSFYSITGLSVQFLDPQLSGRVHFQNRRRERGFDVAETENSFLNIKKTFEIAEKRRKAEDAVKDLDYIKEQEVMKLQKIRKDAE